MSLDVPTPQNSNDDPQDSLEGLRAKLKEQRAEQKASLAKHKQTTFLAVETAKKGTTFLDRSRLIDELKAELEAEQAEDEDEDAATAE